MNTRLASAASSIVATIIALSACTTENATSVFAQRDSIVIEPANALVTACQPAKLTATVRHPDGTRSTPSDIVWSSSEPTFVKAYPDGSITGIEPTRTVTISASRGTARGSTTVHVYARSPSFYLIDFSPDALTLRAGSTVQLAAEAAASNDIVVLVAFRWESVTPSLASVSSTGFVKTVAPGIATIRATFIEPGTIDTLVCARRSYSAASYIRVEP